MIDGKKHRQIPEYSAWLNMRNRCLRACPKDFPYYQGKGVKICERWNSFELFYRDMGPRPEGHSLDRIDGSGNYEPSNCRWADIITQARHQIVCKGTLCRACNERGAIRNFRCHRCSEYLREYGRERPVTTRPGGGVAKRKRDSMGRLIPNQPSELGLQTRKAILSRST
jgi:hypothetical protein